MPSLTEIIGEVNKVGSGHDVVRRRYALALSELTGRNVVVYYSGWLQKGGIPGLLQHLMLNDSDKNGFMAAFQGLSKDKGLDLILHTPGGDIAATESLVHYIRKMFGTDVRAIIPQLAMSAGTMIALSCKQILMGKHSNLGPIDPQIGIFPAHGIIEEFSRAEKEIREAESPQAMQSKIAVWQPIIAKYSPTFIGQCQKAISWSTEIVKAWLLEGMLKDDRDADAKADSIISELGSHAETKSHGRHIHADKLIRLGVHVEMIEADQALQDAILSLHHTCVNALHHTPAVKLIENQHGVGLTMAVQMAGSQQAAQGANQAIPPTDAETMPASAWSFL
jgi:hypothetical protein